MNAHEFAKKYRGCPVEEMLDAYADQRNQPNTTFNPVKHGHPEVMHIELWRGEGISVTRDGVLVCQGRSVNDLLRAIGQFIGLHLVSSNVELLDEVWTTLMDVCEFSSDGKHTLDVPAMRELLKRVDAAKKLQDGTKL
jgi:hypothetical protein